MSLRRCPQACAASLQYGQSGVCVCVCAQVVDGGVDVAWVNSGCVVGVGCDLYG